MHSQGCREFFERSVAVSLTEKVEPKGCDALFIEEPGQGLVGRAVLAGEKSMAQYGNTLGWSVRRAEYRGNAVVMAIVKCLGFFYGMAFHLAGCCKTIGGSSLR